MLPRIDEDTSYGHLNGTVVLRLNKPLSVKELKLHTRGIQYVKYVFMIHIYATNWKTQANASISWDSTTPEGQHKKANTRKQPGAKQHFTTKYGAFFRTRTKTKKLYNLATTSFSF
jgi:hypothetical protein